MKTNMGLTDRTIRTNIAIILLLLYFTHMISGTTGLVLVIIATIFLITSVLGFCPLYVLLGVNTCNNKKQTTSERE